MKQFFLKKKKNFTSNKLLSFVRLNSSQMLVIKGGNGDPDGEGQTGRGNGEID